MDIIMDTHMFYSRLNTTVNQKAKAKASLSHSLRIVTDKMKEGEWEPELQDENFILLEGEIIQLSTLDEARRIEIRDELVTGLTVPAGRSKAKSQRSAYKNKLIKAIDTEVDRDNYEALYVLLELANTPDSTPIPAEFLTKFEGVELARHKQKMSMISKYIKAHNTLVNDIGTLNSAFLQESIMKFPHQWGLTLDDVTRDEHLTFIKNFYEEEFPDYPVKLTCFHDDERGGDELTGAHAHTFVSTQNAKTGEYDLLRKQVEFINRYIAEHEPDEDLFPLDRSLKIAESRRYGEIFQRLMFKRVNEQLLNPKGINAVMTDETIRKTEAYKAVRRESKKPSRNRSHNNATRQQERAERAREAANSYEKLADTLSDQVDDLITSHEDKELQISNLDVEYDELIESIDKAKADLDTAKTQLVNTKNETELAEKSRKSAIMAKITANHTYHEILEKTDLAQDQLEATEKAVGDVESYLQELGQSFISTVSKVVGDIYARMNMYMSKRPDLAKKYTSRIVHNYAEIVPEPLRDICKAAANEASEQIENDDLALKLNEIDKSRESESELN